MMLKKLMVESLFFIRAAGGAGQKRTGSATLLLSVSFQCHVSCPNHLLSRLLFVSCLLSASRLLSASCLPSPVWLTSPVRLTSVSCLPSV